MAIIQISKIQQRSGNLVDLPQLDEAQLGWANDAKRLFIGTTTPNPNENVEVLTAYSNITFSQINGSEGNLNISAASNGEVLSYDGTNWVNKGGSAGGEINLGSVSNITITGGAIGYVLETDGLGNLSWTPKGTLYTEIVAISSASTGIMTVANTTPYTNGQSVTISGVLGANANNVVNGQTFYVELAVDFATTGNVGLYTDASLTAGLNTTTLTATANTGIATSVISSGGGAAAAGGSNTTIQFNDNNVIQGNAGFTFNKITGAVAIPGNVTAGNVSGTLLTGTLTTAAQPNITSVGTLTSLAVTGNISGANVTGTHYGAATGLTSIPGANVTGTVANATYAVTAGTVTTAAQPNITSVGTLTSLAVTGNISGANVTGTHYGAATGLTSIPGANVTGTVANATYATTAGSATTAGTVTTAAQPNITSVGTLTSVTVSANVTTGGIKTDNYYYANGVAISFSGAYSNSNVASYLPTFTGTVGATALTAGSNVTVGTITGNWSLSSGSRLNATYADLAEYYEADKPYESGTVVEFGGFKEVTIAEDGTTRVAGVVSTNPAYVMNSQCKGDYIVALALQGRVPCKVRGTVRKGDMLVSAGEGYARPMVHPYIGSVIGKSLENFDGIEGIIEVAVGRL
jgi:hypothetical protein